MNTLLNEINPLGLGLNELEEIKFATLNHAG